MQIYHNLTFYISRTDQKINGANVIRQKITVFPGNHTHTQHPNHKPESDGNEKIFELQTDQILQGNDGQTINKKIKIYLPKNLKGNRCSRIRGITKNQSRNYTRQIGGKIEKQKNFEQ